MKKCVYKDCPGVREQKLITYATSGRNGTIVVDQVPAIVCKVCGDTGLTMDTLKDLNQIEQESATYSGRVPLYRYQLAIPEQRRTAMPCRIVGCGGHYDYLLRPHVEYDQRGRMVVVDDVPQLSCSECGDTLFDERTLFHVKALPNSGVRLIASVPLYDFAQATAEQPALAEVAA